MGPTVHGRGGRQRQEGGLSSARSHPSPIWSRTDPHWASEGSNGPAPSRGQHQPFETSKAQAEVSQGGGESQEYNFLWAGGPPQSPLRDGAPSLAHPTAATPTCSTPYPSSHLLEILRVAELLDSDRQEIAGDIGDDHIGAG